MSRKEVLVALAQKITQVLQKIEKQTNSDHPKNSSNGRMEFAYVKYYLAEICNLLDLSMYLLTHAVFSKYAYFPTRQIMEIVLQMEHVYAVKKKKGSNAVKRLFFKDIAASAKSSLELPGEGGKEKINRQLGLLNIFSRILRLNFSTDDVSPKSHRDIKSLCEKSNIVVKKCTGSELYNFYTVLSESSHANVISIGASNHTKDEDEAIMVSEMGIELAIRFCELVVLESTYKQLKPDVENLKRIAGI